MNVGTIKTALKRYAGVDDTDPLVDWINAAYHELEEAYPWPFLDALTTVPTVASNNAPVMPADVLKVVTLKVIADSSGAPIPRYNLNYVPRVEFEDESVYDPTVLGEPTHFTLIGNSTVTLWPTPDGVYTLQLFYKKTLADLALDADVPAIPAALHYTLVEGAAIRALQAESEEDRAQTARGTFEDSVQRHISKFGGSRQRGEFNSVRDVMGYGC